MNKKAKTVIGVVAFALLIGAASVAYDYLSDFYKPNNQMNTIDKTDENDNAVEKIKAPDFAVLDADGVKVKLSDFTGKPVVLNFWASWCQPCRNEMPHFDKIYKEVKEDVVFMMVDLTDGKRETIEKAKSFIVESGYSFPVYFDMEQEAAYTYGVTSIPSTLFIDREGYIIRGYRGAIDEETLMVGINLIKD